MKNLFLFAAIAGVVLGIAIYLTSEDNAFADELNSTEYDLMDDTGTGIERGYNAMS